MLDGLRAIPGGVWRTYLAPDAKVLFESINKNACTSLKWMMADLAGEDLAQFRAARKPHIDDSEVVHNRELWTASPRLDALSPEERADIRPDNGWFIFAVVRDPRLRLFSAWQNKLLVESPHGYEWRNKAWYPRHPLTKETVIEDFARFVRKIEAKPTMRLRATDPHFRDQVELLAEDVIPYTKIYDITELKQLKKDLSEHLDKAGQPRELYVPRANPTPLRAISDVFADGIREAIERIYAADFDRFGDMWDFSRVESAPVWTDTELLTCENEAMLGRRISELHNLVRAEREKTDEAEASVEQLSKETDALSRKVSSIEEELARRPLPSVKKPNWFSRSARKLLRG